MAAATQPDASLPAEAPGVEETEPREADKLRRSGAGELDESDSKEDNGCKEVDSQKIAAFLEDCGLQADSDVTEAETTQTGSLL